MIILLGLLVLIAAVVVGVAGVAANSGEVRTDTSDFGVFDYHFSASAGELFLYGMAVGAIGMLGLSLLLMGVRQSSRRNSATRRELRKTRKEAAAARRDTAAPDPARSEKPIPTTEAKPAADQKPVWSVNRFLPKAAAPGSRPKTDVSAK
ncbi:hypothetical protein [Nocardia arizonensis]|uniref:hypothetical protein n=1 Tax=Nocardia arizonensis TaxID=1141647 RepID=UPI0006CFE5DE|nr:hypothetical protein [Nocardia arizonensis]